MFSSPAQWVNRRRFWVFFATFLIASAAGLIFSYSRLDSRPAVYQSQSGVQIEPGAVSVASALAKRETYGGSAVRSTISEPQVRNSGSLVQGANDELAPPEKQKVHPLWTEPVTSQPTAPHFWRDAGLTLCGALMLALLVMIAVEWFNRADVAQSKLVAQPHPSLDAASNSHEAVQPVSNHALRELQQDEVSALLAKAKPQAALFAHLLLRGVSPQEALAVRRKDVNLTDRTLHLGGAAARELPLDDVLESLVFSQIETAPAELEGGMAQSEMLLSIAVEKNIQIAPKKAVDKTVKKAGLSKLDKLTSELASAARGAGIQRPTEITPAALRHTFAAFMARQGLRLGDLARTMGTLTADQAGIYSAYAPSDQRLSLEQVDRLMASVVT